MAEVQAPILPSRLFRYRALNRGKRSLPRELDSILNRYLFCSDFSGMNDPMEGFFRSSKLLRTRSDFDRVLKRLTSSKSAIGIACFSESNDDSLMWAHYAGNYNGICISYSASQLKKGLPENVRLVRLAYVDEPPLVFPSHVRDVEDGAVRILSQKKYNWAYEREWRILTAVGKVTVGKKQPVKAVYLGSRVSEEARSTILSELKGSGIEVFAMRVSGYEHFWRAENSAAKRKPTKSG